MIDALKRAWRRWEAHPGEPYEAGDMEDAAAVVALTLRVTANDLRIRLAERRRAGSSIDVVVAELAAEVGR